MVYVLVALMVTVVLAVIWATALCVSLQEADDPVETRPEDLSEFEKRHVHRTDIVSRV